MNREKNMESTNNQNRANCEEAMSGKSDRERFIENEARIDEKRKEYQELNDGGHKGDAKQVEKEIEELEKKNAKLAEKLDAQKYDEYGVPVSSQNSEQEQTHNNITRTR